MSKAIWVTSLILQFLFFVEPAHSQFPVQENESVNPLTVNATLSPHQSRAGEIVEIVLNLNLEKGYKAYVDQFKLKVLEPQGVKAGELKVNSPFEFFDKFSKRNREAVKDQSKITALLETPVDLAAGKHLLRLALTFQACTEKFCLFPKDVEFTTPIEIIGSGTTAAERSSSDTPAKNETPGFGFDLGLDLERGLLTVFLLVFFAGVLTSFTPCIFPMIPITLAILGRGASERTRWHNFSMSLSYVLGIALTYSTLGLVAASTGAMFGSAMNHPFVLGAMVLLFFVMAVSMYGGFDLQVPAFIRNKLGHKDTGHGRKGAFLMGLISGVVASPCVGPVLVGILTFVAQTQDLLLGFALLFTFALGLGQLFLVLGLSGEMGRFLPKSGHWMDAVKFVFGSVLLAVGFYYLDFLLPDPYWWMAVGLALASVSTLFGAFLQTNEELSNLELLQKGFMRIVFYCGVILLLSPLLRQQLGTMNALSGQLNESSNSQIEDDDWLPYSDKTLQSAAQQEKPVIVDFYADWCVACKELEHITFADKAFEDAADEFVLLRFDATDSSDQLSQLSQTYGIVGLPTVLFFDRSGEWRKDLTLTGFESPQDFIDRMSKIK